jgi:hypothetical protein
MGVSIEEDEVTVDDVIDGSIAEDEPEHLPIFVHKDIVAVLREASSGQQILEACIETAAMLATKNVSYGDSALNPIRIFSKASAVEQLLVRIDDKLSRIANGKEFVGDDTIWDLLGYLVLYRIALKEANKQS